MKLLMLVFYGMLIGVANIIPGVSGGTMAASLGIYDEMIASISHLKREWKKSLLFLGPLLLGAALGVVFFSYSIEFLLSNYPLPTALAFIGLILGGLPLLFHELQTSLTQEKRPLNWTHALIFILFFGLIVWMSYLNADVGAARTFQLSIAELTGLFAIGVLGASAMVIPGVSGSLIFMIFGYYYSIIKTLNHFFDGLKIFDIMVMINTAKFLFPFGVGILVGIFLISRVMEYLFKNYSSWTYSGIIGLVIASPIAVLKNTQALVHFDWSTQLFELFVGVILLISLGFMTYKLGVPRDKQKAE